MKPRKDSLSKGFEEKPQSTLDVKVFFFLFSLIQPVLALPFSIMGSVGRHKSFLPLFSVALAFSMFAFSIDPPVEYDLYRHYQKIDSLSNMSFFQVFGNAKVSYWIFDSYAWLINSIGVSKRFFTASIVFISYLLVFAVFNDLKSKCLKKINQSSIVFIFIAFWLSINFIGLSSGLRNGLSTVMVFYFGYKLVEYNRFFLFSIGSVLSFFIHPFSLVICLIVIFSKYFKRFSHLGKFLIFIGFMFFLIPGLVSGVVSMFDSVFANAFFYKPYYLQHDSQWGGGYADTKNIRGLVASFVIARLPVYVALSYLMFVKKGRDDVVYILLCTAMLYMLVFFNYHTLYSRMSEAFTYFFTFYIAKDHLLKRNFFTGFYLIVYAGSLMIFTIYNIYLLKEHEAYVVSFMGAFLKSFFSFL